MAPSGDEGSLWDDFWDWLLGDESGAKDGGEGGPGPGPGPGGGGVPEDEEGPGSPGWGAHTTVGHRPPQNPYDVVRRMREEMRPGGSRDPD